MARTRLDLARSVARAARPAPGRRSLHRPLRPSPTMRMRKTSRMMSETLFFSGKNIATNTIRPLFLVSVSVAWMDCYLVSGHFFRLVRMLFLSTRHSKFISCTLIFCVAFHTEEAFFEIRFLMSDNCTTFSGCVFHHVFFVELCHYDYKGNSAVEKRNKYSKIISRGKKPMTSSLTLCTI